MNAEFIRGKKTLPLQNLESTTPVGAKAEHKRAIRLSVPVLLSLLALELSMIACNLPMAQASPTPTQVDVDTRIKEFVAEQTAECLSQFKEPKPLDLIRFYEKYNVRAIIGNDGFLRVGGFSAKEQCQPVQISDGYSIFAIHGQIFETTGLLETATPQP